MICHRINVIPPISSRILITSKVFTAARTESSLSPNFPLSSKQDTFSSVHNYADQLKRRPTKRRRPIGSSGRLNETPTPPLLPKIIFNCSHNETVRPNFPNISHNVYFDKTTDSSATRLIHERYVDERQRRFNFN